MTITIQTALGKIKVTSSFPVSDDLQREIEEKLRSAVDDEAHPIEPLLQKIKRELPWVDTPAGALVAYMTGQNWTQAKLAAATGIQQSHISEMRRGKRSIGLVAAKKFGKTFGIDYRKFL